MGKKLSEANDLRKTLSFNIKKQRKILGLTQEKLAEAANLSPQTINDIEGCRMWVSDKTIIKLANVLHIDAYNFFMPIQQEKSPTQKIKRKNDKLLDLEGRIIRLVKQQFEEALIDSG